MTPFTTTLAAELIVLLAIFIAAIVITQVFA